MGEFNVADALQGFIQFSDWQHRNRERKRLDESLKDPAFRQNLSTVFEKRFGVGMSPEQIQSMSSFFKNMGFELPAITAADKAPSEIGLNQAQTGSLRAGTTEQILKNSDTLKRIKELGGKSMAGDTADMARRRLDAESLNAIANITGGPQFGFQQNPMEMMIPFLKALGLPSTLTDALGSLGGSKTNEELLKLMKEAMTQKQKGGTKTAPKPSAPTKIPSQVNPEGFQAKPPVSIGEKLSQFFSPKSAKTREAERLRDEELKKLRGER